MAIKSPRTPPSAASSVANPDVLPPGPEELRAVRAIQVGPEGLIETKFGVPELVNPETTVDLNTAFRVHHGTMTSLVQDQRAATLAGRQVATPGASISSSGSTSFGAATGSFSNLFGPLAQVTLPCVSLVNALPPSVKLPCLGNLLASGTTSTLACRSAVAATTASSTASLTCNGEIAASFQQTVSFRWSLDLATPSWEPIDTAPTWAINEGDVVLLAVRVKLVGTASVTNVQYVEYSSDGTWTALSDVGIITLAAPSSYVAKSNGAAVQVHEFVCNTGGGTKVPGIYSTSTSTAGVALSPGEETEFWYAVKFQSGSSGQQFRFRVTANIDDIEPDADTFLGGVSPWTPVVA